MQNHHQEVIKIVMKNYLLNISSNTSITNNSDTFLDPLYMDEISINKKISELVDWSEQFDSNSKLNINSSIKFIENYYPNDIYLNYYFHANIKAKLNNYSEAINYYNLYLNFNTLCCDALISKSQNEIKIFAIRDALYSAYLWSKSNAVIYSKFGLEFDIPTLVFCLEYKCNIYAFRGSFYAQPLDKNFFGVRRLFKNIYLVPDNYIVRKIIYFKNILLTVTYLSFIAKLILKNQKDNNNKLNKKTLQHKILKYFVKFFTPILKMSVIVVFELLLGLKKAKRYTLFEDAINSYKS